MAVRDVVQAAAGVGGGAGEYIEDLFSTYLFTGTGTTTAITNGIDLDGEGGLVWIKDRDSGAKGHALFDTERGGQYKLQTQSIGAQTSYNNIVFNSDGFTNDSLGDNNGSGTTFASWTWRKSPNFFDVVTYTGSSSTQNIPHNLGSVPGMIIVKRINLSEEWFVYHRSTGASQHLKLNDTDGAGSSFQPWNNTAPTDTAFTVLGGRNEVNNTGSTYVAYLFAHNDAGGFGDDGEQNVISCGSYNTDANGEATVNIGYEPQWILAKASSASSRWYIFDSMRGFLASTGLAASNSTWLAPNLADAEGKQPFNVTSTGFLDRGTFVASGTVIYIAIRRPMKTPEAGTEVFAPEYGLNASAGGQAWSAGFPVDMYIRKNPTGGTNYIASRMTGNGPYMATDSTAAENSIPYSEKLDNMDGVFTTTAYDYTTWISWMFKRAPGFMDVVAYTGSVSSQNISHNLSAQPEIILIKNRTYGGNYWIVQVKNLGARKYLILNSQGALDLPLYNGTDFFTNTLPTSSVFTVGGGTEGGGYDSVGAANQNYIAYLFASLPGVSKVGSYSGTGGNVNVDCGFSAGARFILIKRTDSTGDWYVWDSLRGIVAGNDPYLLLNSTAAEVTSTDYIDPLSSGFTVTSSAPAALNASGGSYIFLAIA